MKLHVWYTLGWVLIILAFVVWEAIGLANKADELQPFTFFARHILGDWTNPIWWLGLGFILWLGVHFLVVHNR